MSGADPQQGPQYLRQPSGKQPAVPSQPAAGWGDPNAGWEASAQQQPQSAPAAPVGGGEGSTGPSGSS